MPLKASLSPSLLFCDERIVDLRDVLVRCRVCLLRQQNDVFIVGKVRAGAGHEMTKIPL